MDALKDIGRPVWLVVMAIGFVWFWPLGLAVLAYLVWTGQLGNAGAGMPWQRSFWSSGNKAFDKHMAAERQRLEDEVAAFEQFKADKLSEAQQREFEEFKTRKAA